MLKELALRVLAWFEDEKGQDLIEYALVTALISVGIITAVILTDLETAFGTWVGNIATAITS